MKESLRKLHVRASHPSNRALVNMLKARGVDPRLIKLASELKCDDCMEVHLPVPHKSVSMHNCEILWHTMQMDIAQIPYKDIIVHALIMVDEASRFMVAHELFHHPLTESRNTTTDEAIKAIAQSWMQYHGYPNVIRHDPEGCFRGIKLEEWASERGILLEPCPAEAHGQIGVVESLIGNIKQDFRRLLRSDEMDPFLGILGVVQAHNHLDRIGGFAPSQWACGRLPTFDGIGSLKEGRIYPSKLLKGQ